MPNLKMPPALEPFFAAGSDVLPEDLRPPGGEIHRVKAADAGDAVEPVVGADDGVDAEASHDGEVDAVTGREGCMERRDGGRDCVFGVYGCDANAEDLLKADYQESRTIEIAARDPEVENLL